MTSFWRNWMQTWCWATLVFGVVLAAAAAPGLEAPTVMFYDFVHWPLDGASSWAENVRFTCGVLGAVMIGWALTIFTLVDVAKRVAPDVSRTIWRGMTMAMMVWFVVDSAISVMTDAPVNALSNTVFLATYLIGVFGSGVLKNAARASA
jgi:hypothetical protein